MSSKSSNNRLLVLLGALILNLAAGSVYVFGTYSGAFKSSGLTQQQIQLVSSIGNVGLYVAIFAGMFYDRKGATQTAIVGTIISSCGYLLSYLTTTGTFPTVDPTLMLSLSFLIAWHGGAWLDCAAVTTAVKLFPKNRGLIVGVVKSFFGLSASVLAQVYQAFFASSTGSSSSKTNSSTEVACPNGAPPLNVTTNVVLSRQLEIDTATTQQEPVPFLLFMSVFTLFIGISGIALLTERHNGSIITVKEENRINRGYIVIGILALYLALVATFEDLYSNSTTIHYISFTCMNIVLLPLWLLPYGMERKDSNDEEDGNTRNAIMDANQHGNEEASEKASEKASESKSESEVTSSNKNNELRNFTVCETIRMLDFWMLWFCHFCGTANGLFFINNISQIDQSLGGAKSTAALYVSILSVFNAVGRMGAGFLSDRYRKTIPRTTFFVVALVFMAIGQGSLALIPSTGWLFIGCGIVGICYGAFWSLIPPMVIELFGSKNVGSNYQILGLAPAAGSVLASVVLAGNVYESHVMPNSNICCGQICFQLTQ